MLGQTDGFLTLLRPDTPFCVLCKHPRLSSDAAEKKNDQGKQLPVKTLNIGTPRLTTIVVLNIKQFNFTMQ